MFPHCGTGASLLQLSFSLLAIVGAFELSNPPTTSYGDSLNVSWTVSPNDPKDFDLRVGFCNSSNASLFFDQPAIDTRASSSRNAIISFSGPSGLELPAACFVRAFDSETGRLLNSSPVELISTGFTFTTSTPVPAATVPSTITSASVTTILSSSTVASAHPTTVFSQPTVLVSVSTDSSLPTLIKSTTSVATFSVSEITPSLSSESIAVASSTATANQSSLVSQDSKRPVGPIVGKVLGSVFAFILLLCLFIALCIWRRRRHRRHLRNKYPFISDETYTGFENHMATGGIVDTRNLQSNQQSTDLVTSNPAVYLEKGDSVGDPEIGTGNKTGSKGEVLKSVDTVSHVCTVNLGQKDVP